MISDVSEGRSQTGMVQGGKGGGLAVITDAASLFRGSLRAAGSRRVYLSQSKAKYG